MSSFIPPVFEAGGAVLLVIAAYRLHPYYSLSWAPKRGLAPLSVVDLSTNLDPLQPRISLHQVWNLPINDDALDDFRAEVGRVVGSLEFEISSQNLAISEPLLDTSRHRFDIEEESSILAALETLLGDVSRSQRQIELAFANTTGDEIKFDQVYYDETSQQIFVGHPNSIRIPIGIATQPLSPKALERLNRIKIPRFINKMPLMPDHSFLGWHIFPHDIKKTTFESLETDIVSQINAIYGIERQVSSAEQAINSGELTLGQKLLVKAQRNLIELLPVNPRSSIPLYKFFGNLWNKIQKLSRSRLHGGTAPQEVDFTVRVDEVTGALLPEMVSWNEAHVGNTPPVHAANAVLIVGYDGHIFIKPRADDQALGVTIEDHVDGRRDLEPFLEEIPEHERAEHLRKNKRDVWRRASTRGVEKTGILEGLSKDEISHRLLDVSPEEGFRKRVSLDQTERKHIQEQIGGQWRKVYVGPSRSNHNEVGRLHLLVLDREETIKASGMGFPSFEPKRLIDKVKNGPEKSSSVISNYLHDQEIADDIFRILVQEFLTRLDSKDRLIRQGAATALVDLDMEQYVPPATDKELEESLENIDLERVVYADLDQTMAERKGLFTAINRKYLKKGTYRKVFLTGQPIPYQNPRINQDLLIDDVGAMQNPRGEEMFGAEVRRNIVIYAPDGTMRFIFNNQGQLREDLNYRKGFKGNDKDLALKIMQEALDEMRQLKKDGHIVLNDPDVPHNALDEVEFQDLLTLPRIKFPRLEKTKKSRDVRNVWHDIATRKIQKYGLGDQEGDYQFESTVFGKTTVGIRRKGINKQTAIEYEMDLIAKKLGKPRDEVAKDGIYFGDDFAGNDKPVTNIKNLLVLSVGDREPVDAILAEGEPVATFRHVGDMRQFATGVHLERLDKHEQANPGKLKQAWENWKAEIDNLGSQWAFSKEFAKVSPLYRDDQIYTWQRRSEAMAKKLFKPLPVANLTRQERRQGQWLGAMAALIGGALPLLKGAPISLTYPVWLIGLAILGYYIWPRISEAIHETGHVWRARALGFTSATYEQRNGDLVVVTSQGGSPITNEKVVGAGPLASALQATTLVVLLGLIALSMGELNLLNLFGTSFVLSSLLSQLVTSLRFSLADGVLDRRKNKISRALNSVLNARPSENNIETIDGNVGTQKDRQPGVVIKKLASAVSAGQFMLSHVMFWLTPIRVIHVDSLTQTHSNETAAYVLDHMNTAFDSNRQHVLVARFVKGSENPEDVKSTIQNNLLRAGEEQGLRSQVERYLNQHVVIVMEPMGLLKPSSIRQQLKSNPRWRHGTNVWLNIFSLTPSEFDLSELMGRFIVYTLNGKRVPPLLFRINAAQATSINA